jgi:hypothetical protein
MTGAPQISQISSRAWYGSTVSEFLQTNCDAIVGRLATNCDFTVLPTQRDAWLIEIQFLKEHLRGLAGSVYMEFSIPRMGRRIDVVLIVGPVVFAIEFKAGESLFERAALDQVWDYALDLKNFHEASHSVTIVPLLIATEADASQPIGFQVDDDKVYRPISVQRERFRAALDRLLQLCNDTPIDASKWARARYYPTPTIVEAARALYAQHSVEAIARFDAGAQNLRLTSSRIEELVDDAISRNRKVICFITGVPGAGKTLVGLNLATRRRDVTAPTHSVYLSGNGPLVAVLREALTRDEVARQRSCGNRVRKGKVGESVKAFIQNVHHFRDDLLIDDGPPAEHVAIFDEAQRAWNLQKTSDFMRRKKTRSGFNQSEPEFLISCMDRHRDWAVIVCLVGGGQEINTGEAGINSWIEAIHSQFPHWDMYISSQLTHSEYASRRAIEVLHDRQDTYFDDSLHLAVSMRSFRAENVSAFVRALLDCQKLEASRLFAQFADRYPIAVSRDLLQAKQWVLRRARGTERYGLIASSKAHRLKPDAIDIRVDVNPVHWFLNDKDDTRSSYYLEDAATEFQVQGLELDWTCVAWDGDLRFSNSGWNHHYFRGDRWCRISNLENKRYLCNAYRVLLTRARQGMVIYVPHGATSDPTRSPEYYDSTYRYLIEVGIPEVQKSD